MTDPWSYKAPPPPADPPASVNMTRDEWERLSPGYRREIARYVPEKGEPTCD